MKNLWIVLAALLSAQAQATPIGNGNGGDGVITGNRVHLFDFIEAGIERNPYFENPRNIDPGILAQLERKFDRAQYPVDLLAAKLTEMAQTSKVQAAYMLATLKLLEWRIVNIDFTNIQDEDTFVDLERVNDVQLAVRQQGIVHINSRYWSRGRGPKLNSAHKVGLLIHEATYAMMPLKQGNHALTEAQQVCSYLQQTANTRVTTVINGPVYGDVRTSAAPNAYNDCVEARARDGVQSSADARYYVANLFSAGGLTRPNMRQTLPDTVYSSYSAYLETLPFHFENENPLARHTIRILFGNGEANRAKVVERRHWLFYQDGHPADHPYVTPTSQIEVHCRFPSDSRFLYSENEIFQQERRSGGRRVFWDPPPISQGHLAASETNLIATFDDPIHRRRVAIFTQAHDIREDRSRSPDEQPFGHFTNPEECARNVRQFFQLPATP